MTGLEEQCAVVSACSCQGTRERPATPLFDRSVPAVAASTQDQFNLLLTGFLGKKNSEGKGLEPEAGLSSRPAGAESGSTEPCPGLDALSVPPSSRAGGPAWALE